MIAKEFDQAILLTKIKKELNPLLNDLRDEFKEDVVDIEAGENSVTIRLLGEATFDTAKAVIRPAFIPLLRKLGKILAGVKGEIMISGHTDNVPYRGGPYHSNLGLSLARAGAVAEFLLKNSSLDPKRVSAMGFGEYRPLTTNETAQGRQKNRRVEIIVTK